MQLIGMLDSPYVRRTAIALRMMDVPFEHRALSVFSTFEQFKAINPAVKAPTLVCDDGTVLMDSTLILDYAQSLARGRPLMPTTLPERQQTLRILGLALAGCEKAVQTVYERALRPAEKQHEPWLNRVRGQAQAAFEQLEIEIARRPLAATRDAITLAGISVAVVWSFAQSMVADVLDAKRYPLVAAFTVQAEQLREFVAFPPDGPGVPKA
jgi:glutathione S-transferase